MSVHVDRMPQPPATCGRSAGDETLEAKRDRKQFVRQLHEAPRVSKWYGLFVVFHLATWALAAWTWFAGLWPLTVLLWLVAAHWNHSELMAYHEAAHETFSANRFWNELRGVVTGLFCGVPLAAYRIVHHTHHAHLGTKRDKELWPFTDPSVPRWFRVLFLAAGLIAGAVVTPLLFLRGAFDCPRIPRRVRRRLWLEYVLLVGFWSAVVTIVAAGGWWEALLVGFGVPAFLAGLFQTVRLLIEHLGLFGDDALSLSRTVVAKGPISRFISRSMLHVDQHGPHHVFGRVPRHRLPDATEHFCGAPRHAPEELVFGSYLDAARHTLPHLVNPRIGSQWKLDASRQNSDLHADR
jgi:fatty acid desaturase